jgi:non-ribosomal peptide synthetase component F
MQRLEPILKSWLIWLILAASAAAFVALVVTDGDAHTRRHTGHPKRSSGRTLTPDAAWGGRIAYAVPRRGADPTVVRVATSSVAWSRNGRCSRTTWVGQRILAWWTPRPGQDAV